MTPYYERDGIVIYCGETITVMSRLDGPFDAIIADLPYGTTACSWDTVIPFEPLWEQYKRLTRGAVVLFGSQPFTSALVMSNLDWFKYCWVWEKSKASNFPHAPNMPLKIFEDIAVFSNGSVGHISQAGSSRMTYNPQGTREGSTIVKQNPNSSQLKYHRESQTNHTTGYKCKREGYPTTHLKYGINGRSIHPTQKPVALLAYLIRTYTNPGEIVLDNTMGSGTTLVAAQREGRRAVGIEISEEYCKIAVERLRQRSLWQIEQPEREVLPPTQAELFEGIEE